MQLVDFLVARGRLDPVQRQRVLALRRERGESESLIITRLGMIAEREMAEQLSEFLGIPLVRPEDYPTAPLLPGDLTREFVARAQALPLPQTEDGLALAMADPTDEYAVQAIR